MSRPGSRSVLRVAVRAVGLFACCWLVAGTWASAAGAHAVLVSTDPTDNTVLRQSPLAITLTFNEPIQVVQHTIRIFDPHGDEQQPVSVASRDAVISASLDTLTVEGTYTVGWEVVSADGHDVKGGFVFHLRTRTASAPQHLDSSPARLALGLRSVGTTLSIGALAVVLADRSRRSGRVAWAVALLGAAAAAAGATASIGGSLTEGYDILSTNTTGRLLAAGVVIAAVGLVLAATPLRRALAAGGIVVAALPGHAVALDPAWRSITLTLLHVAATAAWACGLLWLVSHTRDGDAERTVRAVERFSPWAMGSVGVVAATGSVLLVTRTGWGGLWTSGYGVLGLVKIALLGVALGLAARNRWRLTPSLSSAVAGDGLPMDRLRRSIRAEVVVLALALLAGTVLGQVAPPTLEAVHAPFLQRAAFGDGQVELLVDPARVGENQLHVSALHRDGTLNGQMLDLSVELRLVARNVGPLQPNISANAGGHLVATANLTLAGTWSVRITGHVGTFDQLIATFEVVVA